MSGYAPTASDILQVVQLLRDNGVIVSNSKAAYKELQQYELNPHFCVLLSTVFSTPNCPVSEAELSGASWNTYRRLAGVTLKNNLNRARHALGEAAVQAAASKALEVLRDAPNPHMARVAAQIVVKITSLTSFEWWSSNGLDLGSLLLEELLCAGGLKTLSALYALQYVMEDVPKQVGKSSEKIVTQVCALARDPSAPVEIQKAAFRMCYNIYEQAYLLEWNVETLSDLQHGLVSASWSFAEICTSLLECNCNNDVAFVIEVLRSCYLLLDYFDYFPPEALTRNQERLQNIWVGVALDLICNSSFRSQQSEMVAEAVNFVIGILEAFEQSCGEGSGAFLAGPIYPQIPTLLDALVASTYLTEEEIEDIMANDDYRLRSTISNMPSSGEKDIAEDNCLEDDAAAKTLRRSASKCIEMVCLFEPNAAFGLLSPKISEMWNSQDWKAKEVGYLVLGTMTPSCFSQLESMLPSVAKFVAQELEDESQHVCVKSMALWGLSRGLESLYTIDSSLFGYCVQSIASCLQSTSKRVQYAAISGFLDAMIVVQKYGASKEACAALFAPRIPLLCQCLSVYHTSNLSALIHFLMNVLPFLAQGDPSSFAMLAAALRSERATRAAAFEHSYAAFVNNAPNSVIDKDIFSLDRGVLQLLVHQPDSPAAAQSLKTWTAVLGDLLQRNETEDADLLFNVLLSCTGYIHCISTRDYQSEIRGCFNTLSTAAFHIWDNASNSNRKNVEIACITLLGSITGSFDNECISPDILQSIHTKIARRLADEEDPRCKNQLTVLGTRLLKNQPEYPLASATFFAVNGILRNDVHGESLPFFIEMASHVSCTLPYLSKELLLQANIAVIADLLARGTNDTLKSEATSSLCAVLPNFQSPVLENYGHSLLAMVFSWQQAASQYPNTHQALRGLLLLLHQQCAGWMQQKWSATPVGLREMIQTTYQL